MYQTQEELQQAINAAGAQGTEVTRPSPTIQDVMQMADDFIDNGATTPEQRELLRSTQQDEAGEAEKRAKLAAILEANGLPTDDPELYALAPYLLNVTDNVKPQIYAYSYEGTAFAPIGDIHLITAAKKSGKSFFVSELIAAALSPTGWEGITCNLTNPRLLYVDTEQHRRKTKDILERAYRMAQLDPKKHDPRMQTITLREQANREERQKLTRIAIEHIKPDIVFIDGTADLKESINDEQEANEEAEWQKRQSSIGNCAIWNVIHLPKSTQGATSARGFLGTAIENAACDIFRLTKTKPTAKEKEKGEGETYYTIEHESRNKDIEDIKFRIHGEDYDGTFYPIPRRYEPTAGTSTGGTAPPPISERDKLKKLLEQVFGSVSTLNTGTITERIQQAENCAQRKADSLKKKAKELGLLQPVEGQANTFQFIKDPDKSNEEELPF